MHLQRVGFGFGWLYSLHGRSALGFHRSFFVPSHPCADKPPKNLGSGASSLL